LPPNLLPFRLCCLARSHNPPPKKNLSFPTFFHRTLSRTLPLLPCCNTHPLNSAANRRLVFQQQTSPLSTVYFCVQSHVEATKTEVYEFISEYEPTNQPTPQPHTSTALLR
jgi:hypothetical protein